MEVSKRVHGVMAEPIGVYSLPQNIHSASKNRVAEILQNFDVLPDEIKRSGSPGLTHISNRRGQNVFSDFAGLEAVQKIILQCASDFLISIGYKDTSCFISDAWLNLGAAGASLKAHAHYNSFLSGTYYVNYDSKVHSRLTFVNDRIASAPKYPVLSIPYSEKSTDFNSRDIVVDHNEGDILFWKSHLIHGYSNNPSPGRTTISFNLMPSICSDGDIYAFRAAPF